MTDWPVKTLGDVCDVIAGQSPEGKFYNKEGKGVPFYQGKKDFAERVLGSPTTWTSEVTKLARPGDILMSVRAPVGPVNLCPIEACIGRGLAAIRPSSKTDTDFIYYYLESIQSEIAGTEGAVFASINKAQIEGLRCPVPPLEEQKRIVALLDAATARVTELTACYEQARTHANNLFTSALRDSLEGNPDWPVKTLDALCDEGVVLLGRGNIISKKDIAANPGPYPIYSSARENEGKFGEYGAYMFNEEMITWSIDGGGRLFYRPKHKFSVTNVGGTLRVLKPNVLEIRYLHRALENLHLKKVFDWVFKAHPSVIRKVYDEIPVPPLEEQKKIVARLDSMKAKTSEMVAAYDAKLNAAKNLRQSILEAAFAGDL